MPLFRLTAPGRHRRFSGLPSVFSSHVRFSLYFISLLIIYRLAIKSELQRKLKRITRLSFKHCNLALMLSPLVVFDFPIAGSRPPWVFRFFVPLPFVEIAFRCRHLMHTDRPWLVPAFSVAFHVSGASLSSRCSLPDSQGRHYIPSSPVSAWAAADPVRPASP